MTATKFDHFTLHQEIIENHAGGGWYLMEEPRLEKAKCVFQCGLLPLYGLKQPARRSNAELITSPARLTDIVWSEGLVGFLFFQDEQVRDLYFHDTGLSMELIGDPCDSITIFGPKIRREERKKIEGGGWREVVSPGPLIKLQQPERYRARIDREQRAQMEADRKAWAEAKAKKEALEERRWAELRTRAKAMTDKLTEKLLGASVAQIEPHSDCGGITITFGDGRSVDFHVEGHNAYFLIDDEELEQDEFDPERA